MKCGIFFAPFLAAVLLSSIVTGQTTAKSPTGDGQTRNGLQSTLADGPFATPQEAIQHEQLKWNRWTPGEAGAQKAYQQAERDLLENPEWARQHGIDPRKWSAFGPEQIRGIQKAIVEDQYSRVINTIQGFEKWSWDDYRYGPKGIGGPRALSNSKQWWLAAKNLRAILQRDYPYGFLALDSNKSWDALNLENLAYLEREAEAKLATLEMAEVHAHYGTEKLASTQARSAVNAAQGRFSGILDQPALNRAYENNSKENPADLIALGAVPVAGPSSETSPRAEKGLRIREVPNVRNLKSAAEGIAIFEPPQTPAGAGGRPGKKKQKVFDEALRHIYEIPEGKKVLADLQQMREEWSQRMKKINEERLKTLPKMRQELADETKALSDFEKKVAKTGAAKAQDPPEGRIFLAAVGADGDFAPGKMADRCPEGEIPVRTDKPQSGDKACRSAGDRPKILMATDDAFQPYAVVEDCPRGDKPEIGNWPGPGDSYCKGTGLRNRVKMLEKDIQFNEQNVKAMEKYPKVFVYVDISKPKELTGGHADPLHVQMFRGGRGDYFYVMRVNVTDECLKDGNPARACDKIMMHELRHVADEGLLHDEVASGMRWLLIEDRAFLSESRAVIEQKPEMKRERRSDLVDALFENEALPRILRPESSRLELISSPLYLWHVSPADVKDPQAALRGRLMEAFYLLKNGPAARYIDSPDRQLMHALDQSRAALSDELSGSSKVKTAFLDLAAKTQFAQDWVKGLERLAAQSPGNGTVPQWQARLQKYEDDYWKDLGDFSARYHNTEW